MFSFHFVNVYTPEMCCVQAATLEPVNWIGFSAIVRKNCCAALFGIVGGDGGLTKIQ